MDGIGIGIGIAGWGGVLITYFTLWVKFHISTGACMGACIFVEMFTNSIGAEDFSTPTYLGVISHFILKPDRIEEQISKDWEREEMEKCG